MKHSDPKISLQAIEFWSTVCDKEIELQYNDEETFGFASIALPYIIPVLLELLIKQTEDDDDEEWNVAMAAATCLGILASCVEDDIIVKDHNVIQFVQKNVASSEWKYREAAVMAFGSILDGKLVAYSIIQVHRPTQ
jgi:importin subunit beta-1